MDLTPEAIRAVEFRWRKTRGYDGADVDQFVEEMAVGVGALLEHLAALADRAARAEHEVVALRNSEDAMRRTLMHAQQTADEIMEGTRIEAERRLAELEAQRVTILAEAEQQRLAVLAEAERQRHAMLAEASNQARRSQVDIDREARAELDRLIEVRNQLQADIDALRQHVVAERRRVRAALHAALQALERSPGPAPAPAVHDVEAVTGRQALDAPPQGPPRGAAPPGASGPLIPPGPPPDRPETARSDGAEPGPVAPDAPPSAPPRPAGAPSEAGGSDRSRPNTGAANGPGGPGGRESGPEARTPDGGRREGNDRADRPQNERGGKDRRPNGGRREAPGPPAATEAEAPAAVRAEPGRPGTAPAAEPAASPSSRDDARAERPEHAGQEDKPATTTDGGRGEATSPTGPPGGPTAGTGADQSPRSEPGQRAQPPPSRPGGPPPVPPAAGEGEADAGWIEAPPRWASRPVGAVRPPAPPASSEWIEAPAPSRAGPPDDESPLDRPPQPWAPRADPNRNIATPVPAPIDDPAGEGDSDDDADAGGGSLSDDDFLAELRQAAASTDPLGPGEPRPGDGEGAEPFDFDGSTSARRGGRRRRRR